MTTGKQRIELLTKMLATHGIPHKMITGNGPPFQSKVFKQFKKNNGITQDRKAPLHQKANATAENLRVFDALFYTRKLYAPFMNKIFRKDIYTRSRLQHNFNKNSTNENKVRYKKKFLCEFENFFFSILRSSQHHCLSQNRSPILLSTKKRF